MSQNKLNINSQVIADLDALDKDISDIENIIQDL